MEDDKTLRERFDKRGFSISKYAKAYGLDQSTLSRVLDGKRTGTISPKGSGGVRKAIAQLKKDGVWIGKLPWRRSA